MKRSLGAKTLVFPTPTWIVGTFDKEGKPNGMTAAWGGICCSDPPCVAVSLRKATYSYGSLIERKAFTVSVYYGVGASLGHAFAVGKEI
jgi:flavin reductase (DIM6/NTAB) family NADH-FMN oxidoreductase RutF